MKEEEERKTKKKERKKEEKDPNWKDSLSGKETRKAGDSSGAIYVEGVAPTPRISSVVAVIPE
jgi:hypothetical protein